MKRILTGALAALTLGGALAATAVPASAAPWHGGYGYRGGYHGGWGYGGVAAAGILGLAAGAAIADSYGPSYYAPPPAYVYGPRCRVEMRWNPGWGGYDQVRVCY
jgi:hypothetical protein